MIFFGAKFDKVKTLYIHVYCHKILRRIMNFFPTKMEKINMILTEFFNQGAICSQYVTIWKGLATKSLPI